MQQESTVVSHCAQCGKTYVDKNLHGAFTKRFGLLEGESFFVPSCDCRAKREAEERTQEFYAERMQATFNRLGLGLVKNIHPAIPDIGAPWNTAKAGLESGANLVLVGSVGSGKTTILKHIVRDLTYALVPIRGGYVPALMSSLKHMDSVDEILASIENGKVLVLDDLDKILGTVYEIEKLSTLVNICIQKGRPILVTTNLDFPALKRLLCSNKYNVPENWVESFLSRLQAGAQVVKINGSDHRNMLSLTEINI